MEPAINSYPDESLKTILYQDQVVTYKKRRAPAFYKPRYR